MAVPTRFALIRELGTGGMGTVYEAVDRELDVHVALKILHEGDSEAIEKLKHEFRVAAHVRHENLVRLGELFEHEHRWCFSMELVDGVDLVTHVGLRPPILRADQPTLAMGKPVQSDDTADRRRWDGEAPSEAAFDGQKLRRAVAQLAHGLAALHAAGIVHRDVKSSNIRVTPEGRLVLLDLGIAAVTADLRDSSLMMGTVEFMAPEQSESGVVGTAADLYALGAVLYQTLVGRPPFIGPRIKVVLEKLTMDPLPPASLFPEIPADLDTLCMALLSRDPAKRPTAAQVAERLEMTDAAPAVPAPVTTHAFVGREQELKALLRAGERARRAPAVRVVTGPSGIGKTRLLGRFVQACRDYGSFACLGRCRIREHVRLNAWEALLDHLTRTLSAMPTAELTAVLPDDAEAIARLFPIFARVLPVVSSSSVPAAELERRALVALRELLRRLAVRTNVIIVIDDVQWATPESLSLFARLLEGADAPPLALVLGLRTSDTKTDQFAAWLERISDLEVDLSMMAIGPLEPAEARSLAHLLVGDRERAETIAKETGGHPLFLELLATSALGTDALDLTLRQTIQNLPDARALLGVLAASGTPLRIDLLGIALERDPFAIVDELRGLLVQRLVSVTGLRQTDHVELFHSQVAEAMLAIASPEQLRSAHRQLAAALEQMPFIDPERHVLHWAWAGDPQRAVREAVKLVGAARHALAYSRAADACQIILGLALPSPARAELQRAYADALAGSGLAMRAAVAYRDAAAAATGDRRLDLERRAAENFLRCGSVEDGMALFERITKQLGYRAQQSPTAAIAALLVERARLRIRGTVPRIGEVDRALAARSDACFSLSTGLAMVDAISGALFQTRSTRFALDAGDPARAARALAIEACFVSAWGSRRKARADKIIDVARNLARQVDEPYVTAVVETARGICESQYGNFAAAVDHCDRAVAIFREHCAGVVWEERTGEVFALWALAWRGDWGEVGRRCETLLRSGAATGERYASIHAAVGPAVCGLLAHDQPDHARARIAEVMTGWPRTTYDLPQVRELVGLATIGLYEGKAADVLRMLRSDWPALEKSRMLGLEPVLGTLGDLRLRAALLAGDDAEVQTWCPRLDRVPWGGGVVALARAAVAARKGNADRAVTQLELAERLCTASGLDLYAAAARDRRGRVIGGDEGQADIASAADMARTREIRRPDRVFAALAPWPTL